MGQLLWYPFLSSIQLHNFGILFLHILNVLVDTVGDIRPKLGQPALALL